MIYAGLPEGHEKLYANRDGGIDQKAIETLAHELDTLAEKSLHVPEKVFLRVQQDLPYVCEEDSGNRNVAES
jgi:hypothetical protein